MITVGTAGHIDHGKSAIVRRLTGTDPDRLPEEKARGMTIDLGFAFYRTESGVDIALVDVPGHERFVKNMIAGAGGIDAVMLVVAADDGWMPQTEEHFQITKLLGIRYGWVIINKCDLVETDWLDLLEEEISENLAGSFLDGCPVLRLSAQTGDGFDSFRTLLDQLPQAIPSRLESGKARLFADRSFVRPGIGGIVTGTLRGGSLEVGQAVSVWPSCKVGRIRTLHSRGEEVNSAGPGQRTAVSITGVERDLLIRGGVISERTNLQYFLDNPVLALDLQMIRSAPLPVTDRRRALVIVGTTETEGEIRVFARNELRPSERGIVYFRPDNPMYALVGDHFIVRLPTPMVTLGGGTVLDQLPRFPRRRELEELSYLSMRLDQSPDSLIRSELRKRCSVRRSEILESSVLLRTEIDSAISRLLDNKTIRMSGEYLYETDFMAVQSSELLRKIEGQLQQNSHLVAINVEALYSLCEWPREVTSVIIAVLEREGRVCRDGNGIGIAGREKRLTGEVKRAYEDVMAKLALDKFAPPSLSDLATGGKPYQQAIGFIVENGEGHKCGSEFILLRPIWDEIMTFVRESLSEKDALKPADLRERFGFSRKYAIPVLEETDRIGLTRRDGDVRRRGEMFDSEHSLS